MAFETLVGNQKVKDLLVNTIKSEKILHSYLFSGIDGIGKSLFAKEFSRMILCTSKEFEVCKNCKSCIEFNAGEHPDYIEIYPKDGKSIKIEEIRFMQEKIAEKPITSTRKVYVINECDTMTREAQNSLLKTLEEPPIYATIILITSNESKLLPTIKSRCTKINFTPITDDEIQEYVKSSEKEISTYMIKKSSGSIGNLLKIQDDKESYEKIEKIVENLSKKSLTYIWKNSEILYKEKEKIQDFLDYMNVIFWEKINSQKNMNMINSIQIIEEAKRKILSNANYDMTIDDLLLKLWEEIN